MLPATTAYTFSTSQLPKVLRERCAFYILTWKCASRHNGVHFLDISTSKSGPRMVFYILTWKCASRHHGVQFFISHLATWLRTSRFSEATFRPRGHKSLEKHSVWRLFYLFARLHLLSSDSVSSLIFFLLFSSLTLPTSAFPSLYTVGSLTSKLPSIIYLTIFSCSC